MTDYQANMTLDEIAANDLEMTRDAVKNAKRYCFMTPRVALRFQGECVKVLLIRLGLPNFEKIPAKLLKKIQKEKQILVEHRSRYDKENLWRNGVYVYQRGELAGFISDVVVREEEYRLISLPNNPSSQAGKFCVITNVKTAA